MWRSSKRLMISCIQFAIRCGRSNLDVEDLDDIPDYDVQDVPVHFQPQTFGLPRQPRQDDLQHRPDAPGTRRTSPPEVVTRMLRALEEMGESVGPSTVDKTRGDSSKFLEFLLHPARTSY